MSDLPLGSSSAPAVDGGNELMLLRRPDREAVLMASDPASPEYQYGLEAEAPSSEISPSDDEMEDPQSSQSEPPPIESMDVEEESAAESIFVAVVEGRVSPSVEGASSFDLDSLMAGLSRPIDHSSEEAMPPEANDGANNGEELPSVPPDGSSLGIIDFRSLINRLGNDMNVDLPSSENENSDPASTPHSTPLPQVPNGPIERLNAFGGDWTALEARQSLQLDSFSRLATNGSVNVPTRVRGDAGTNNVLIAGMIDHLLDVERNHPLANATADFDLEELDRLSRQLAGSPQEETNLPLFLRSSSPTTVGSTSPSSRQVDLLEGGDGMGPQMSTITLFVSYVDVDGWVGVYVERGMQVPLPEASGGMNISFKVLLEKCRECGNRTGRLVERLIRGTAVFYVGTNVKPVPLDEVLASPASQIAYQEVGALARVINDRDSVTLAAPCVECAEQEAVMAVGAGLGAGGPCYVLYLSPEEMENVVNGPVPAVVPPVRAVVVFTCLDSQGDADQDFQTGRWAHVDVMEDRWAMWDQVFGSMFDVLVALGRKDWNSTYKHFTTVQTVVAITVRLDLVVHDHGFNLSLLPVQTWLLDRLRARHARYVDVGPRTFQNWISALWVEVEVVYRRLAAKLSLGQALSEGEQRVFQTAKVWYSFPLAQAMTGTYVPTDKELLVLKDTTPYEMWTGLVLTLKGGTRRGHGRMQGSVPLTRDVERCGAGSIGCTSLGTSGHGHDKEVLPDFARVEWLLAGRDADQKHQGLPREQRRMPEVDQDGRRDRTGLRAIAPVRRRGEHLHLAHDWEAGGHEGSVRALLAVEDSIERRVLPERVLALQRKNLVFRPGAHQQALLIAVIITELHLKVSIIIGMLSMAIAFLHPGRYSTRRRSIQQMFIVIIVITPDLIAPRQQIFIVVIVNSVTKIVTVANIDSGSSSV
ncbi:uncharacterized protein EV420DRAFT_1481552 [Desarmillaria tabescens]|uniref:Uncharacterized protein n=1 Tax=Armillaria tabescens TaxID=1929756 RepID=A0AA39K678_ARMTA|nr:uncharacterized protein EV420DRAFT_1481552 [Desarmillaria tabescens]KAK0455316.1 hypothetical protein EV420DRAFT_1481552 [Desarmillaria tabescens]